MNGEMDPRLDAKLDRLLTAYRDAIPDQEAGPMFMPELWERIEARRSNRWFFRMTRVVVAAGALAAMVLVVVPDVNEPETAAASYIEALSRSSSADGDMLQEVAYLDVRDDADREEAAPYR